MERESSLDERLRKDQERADEIRARQIRLGHIPADVEVEEEKPAPKAARKKTAEE